MIKNFLHASNRLFKSKFPPKHNRNISSLGKLSYGDLFIPITLFISESPHLTGSFKSHTNGRNFGSCWPTMFRPFARSFKGSQILQQNSEYRSNDVNNPWTWCTRWTKRWPAFWHESQCPTGRASFWVKSLTVRKNARGMPLGSGRFWNWLVSNLTLVAG